MEVTKRRIGSIDFIKGVLILWVVWYHIEHHPAVITLDLRMPAFIFLSGLFFKYEQWGAFLMKRVRTLLIPFLFFYGLFYSISLVHHLLGLNLVNISFEYLQFLRLLGVHTKIDGFDGNIILWFLFGIFWIQLVYQWIYRITANSSQRLILAGICTVLGLGATLYVKTPLAFGYAMSFVIYYALGAIWGKRLVQRIEQPNGWKGLFMLSCIAGIYGIEQLMPAHFWVTRVLVLLETLLFVYLAFGVGQLVHNRTPFRFFAFYGRNSLIVLGLHSILLNVVWVVVKRMGGVSIELLSLLTLVGTALLFIPVIYLCNRYIPFLVGKSDQKAR